jgi:hypothetical protein
MDVYTLTQFKPPTHKLVHKTFDYKQQYVPAVLRRGRIPYGYRNVYCKESDETILNTGFPTEPPSKHHWKVIVAC